MRNLETRNWFQEILNDFPERLFLGIKTDQELVRRTIMKMRVAH